MCASMGERAAPDDLTPLIKEGGEPFTIGEVAELSTALDRLSPEERKAFLGANSGAIAQHEAQRMLVVSGPGTGKSFMFRNRLKSWLARHPDSPVVVATFVRKLVDDLKAEIAGDDEIQEPDKRRVQVSTLHRLARSIVERSRGTRDLPLRPNCQIAAGNWSEQLIWRDTLCLHPGLRSGDFPWEEMRSALYDGEPPTETGWLTC